MKREEGLGVLVALFQPNHMGHIQQWIYLSAVVNGPAMAAMMGLLELLVGTTRGSAGACQNCLGTLLTQVAVCGRA